MSPGRQEHGRAAVWVTWIARFPPEHCAGHPTGLGDEGKAKRTRRTSETTRLDALSSDMRTIA